MYADSHFTWVWIWMVNSEHSQIAVLRGCASSCRCFIFVIFNKYSYLKQIHKKSTDTWKKYRRTVTKFRICTVISNDKTLLIIILGYYPKKNKTFTVLSIALQLRNCSLIFSSRKCYEHVLQCHKFSLAWHHKIVKWIHLENNKTLMYKTYPCKFYYRCNQLIRTLFKSELSF